MLTLSSLTFDPRSPKRAQQPPHFLCSGGTGSPKRHARNIASASSFPCGRNRARNPFSTQPPHFLQPTGRGGVCGAGSRESGKRGGGVREPGGGQPPLSNISPRFSGSALRLHQGWPAPSCFHGRGFTESNCCHGNV